MTQKFLREDQHKNHPGWHIPFCIMLATMMFSIFAFNKLPTFEVLQPVAPIVAQADDDKTTDTTSAFADAAAELSKKLNRSEKTYAGDLWSYFGPKSTFLGKATQHSYSSTYNNLTAGSKKKDTNKAMNAAGNFGYMMNQTGLDHSDTAGFGTTSMTTGFGRLIIGGLTIIGYGMTAGVIWLFNTLISLLDYINIWAWVADWNNAPTVMQPIAKVVHDTYEVGQQIGLVGMAIMLGVSFALAIMGINMSTKQGMRSASTGSGIGGAIVGFFTKAFTIFGLPLILMWAFGVTITITKQLYQNLSTSSVATFAIYSNLVDNRGWAEGTRYAIPPEINIPNSHSAGDVPLIKSKDVLMINARGAGRQNAQAILNTNYGDSDPDHSEGQKYDSKPTSLNPAPLNILMDWTFSSTYKASDWASFTQATYSGGSKDLKKDLTSNDKDSLNKDGTLDVSNGNFVTKGAISAGVTNDEAKSLARINPGEKGGLATMGMYNYLSTVFTSTSLTWSDVTGFTNISTSPIHYAIGMAGRGPIALGNGFMMITLSIIGAVFAAACGYYTLRSLIQSVPRMYVGLIGTVVGSPQSGVRLVLAFLDFLVDSIGAGVVYLFGSQLLTALAMSPDALFGANAQGIISMIVPSGMVAGAHGVTTAATSGFLYGFTKVAAALVLWAIFVALVKYLKPLLKTIKDTYGGLATLLSRSVSTAKDKFGGSGKSNGGSTPTGSPAPATGGPALSISPVTSGANGGVGTMHGGDGSKSSEKSNTHNNGGNTKTGDRKTIQAREHDVQTHGSGAAGGGHHTNDREARLGSPMAMLGLPSPSDVEGSANGGLTGDRQNDAQNSPDGAATGAGDQFSNEQDYSHQDDAQGDIMDSQDMPDDASMGAGDQLANDNQYENSSGYENVAENSDDLNNDYSDQDNDSRDLGQSMQDQKSQNGNQFDKAEQNERNAQSLQDISTANQGDLNANGDQIEENNAQPMDSALDGQADSGDQQTHQTTNDNDRHYDGNENNSFNTAVRDNNQQSGFQNTHNATSQHNQNAQSAKQFNPVTTGSKRPATNPQINRAGNYTRQNLNAKSFNQTARNNRQPLRNTNAHPQSMRAGRPQATNNGIRNSGTANGVNRHMNGQRMNTKPSFNSPTQARGALNTARANVQQSRRALSSAPKGSAAYTKALNAYQTAQNNYCQTQRSVLGYQSKQPAPHNIVPNNQGVRNTNAPRINNASAYNSLNKLSGAYSNFAKAKASGDASQVKAAGQAIQGARSQLTKAGFAPEYLATPKGVNQGMSELKAAMTFQKPK